LKVKLFLSETETSESDLYSRQTEILNS